MFFKQRAPFFSAIFVLALVFVGGLAAYLHPIPHDAQMGDSNATPASFTTQQWADGITRSNGQSVSLDLGDRAGGGGSDDDNRLCILLMAQELDKYPKATTFTVSWSYTVAMGTDELNLVYDRPTGVLTLSAGGRGKPVVPDGYPINAVTDAMIQAAAKRYDSYLNVKN